MKAEWWKASEVDDYNLKNKLLRVGCRPLKRSFLSCRSGEEFDAEKFARCAKVKTDMEECYKALHYL